MAHKEYISWVREHFPNAELTSLGEFISKTSSMYPANDETAAYFIVWFLSLDPVVKEIENSHLEQKSDLDNLIVPDAGYLRNKDFINTLKATAEEESRIIRNASAMLARLRSIRHGLLCDIIDLSIIQKPIKK